MQQFELDYRFLFRHVPYQIREIGTKTKKTYPIVEEGYITKLMNPQHEIIAEIRMIVMRQHSAEFQIWLDGKHWLTLKRPSALGWYVRIELEPQLATVKRSISSRSFNAFFHDGWEVKMASIPFKPKYSTELSDNAPKIKGLAFALAMDLGMQKYGFERRK
jgi:hypothetical protein